MIRYEWEVLEKSKPTSVEDIRQVLLRNRGVDASFLHGDLKDLECHLSLSGMDEGADLVAGHLAAGNKVVIIGDYDCDGITSVAQMVHFLRDIGHGRYAVVIPRRAEGYGVPERAIHAHLDAKLFVAVDCGTHDVRSVSAARRMGADFIVIDHHEVSTNGLAPATVLVNPKQPSCPSVFKDFCASGLTLLFLSRLRKALGDGFPVPRLGGKYLSLAAIGTVADLVPLVDANRILARSGLNCMNQKTFLPINRLAEAAGLSGKVLTAGHIGYYLGPRINAAGRMADGSLALELLTAEQEEALGPLSDELNSLNSSRQYLEDRILKEIRNRYTDEHAGRRTLIMGDPDWNHGVVGIIASRIQQDLHYGPTIVFSIDEGTGAARGSARSVPGFDIYSALESCGDLLLKWGGHKMAAGMTIAVENLDKFSARFEEVARTCPQEVFVPRKKVDMELDLSLLSPELSTMLKQFEPHGLGNPLPTFAARNVGVVVHRTFGRKTKHLHLILDNRVDGIFWRGERCLPADWRNGDHLDLLFQIEYDGFRRKTMLSIKDVRKPETFS